MTYQELLSTTDWKNKRYSIITQDNFECRNCDNKTYFKRSEIGEVIKGSLTGQVGDYLNKKQFIKNIYQISFVESNLSYIYSEGTSKPIYKSSFSSYDYYKPDELNSFKVLYEEHNDTLVVNCIANDAIDPYRWVYVRNLHIHHKYYQEGKNPWQYPNDALITLCWACHEELHKNSTVPWLDEKGNVKGQLTNCRRCYGAGYIPKYSYFENGICFDCFGKRFDEFKNRPEKER